MRCLVVGLAKSGTTALHYSIAKSLVDPKLYFEEPICSTIDIPETSVVKIIFGSEDTDALLEFGKRFDHCFIIIRDPRDILISSLLYTVAATPKKLGDNILMADFIALLKQKQCDPNSVDTFQLIGMVDLVPDYLIGSLVHLCNRLADFLERAQHWTLVRYEAMVGGDLTAVSDALGRSIPAGVIVDSSYARVSRTNGAGDWRRWLTARDVARLRSRFGTIVQHLGYVDDWKLLPVSEIHPEHSWLYEMRLITERRRHFGLPSPVFELSSQPFDTDWPQTRNACSICGGTQFGPGPGGRLASSGRMPACLTCGSLERHRALNIFVQALPVSRLLAGSILTYGNVLHLNPALFRSWTKGGNIISNQISTIKDVVDFIVVDHVFEYTVDDRDAFDYLMKVLARDGLMLVFFSNSQSRHNTQHINNGDGLKHLYGSDLIDYFECAAKNIFAATINVIDDCTNVSIVFHMFFEKNLENLASVQNIFDKKSNLLVRQITS